jgi:Helix-turn-helix of insertion element transposase
MSGNGIKIERLTARQEKAAVMVAEDRNNDAAIAEACGIAERTLGRWKKSAAFSSRVAEILGHFRRQSLKTGLARKDRRLGHLNEAANKLFAIMEARAKDKAHLQFPGGETGLVAIADVKEVAGKMVAITKTDTALVAELRAIFDQIAGEVGDKISRHELTGANGGPFLPTVRAFSPQEAMAAMVNLKCLTSFELEIVSAIFEAALSRHDAGMEEAPADEDTIAYPGRFEGETFMLRRVPMVAGGQA